MTLGNFARRTKIIATVGPSQRYTETDAPAPDSVSKVNSNTIRAMILEGVNVFRLNFSHAKKGDSNHTNEKEFAWIIREEAARLGAPVEIMGDLQGPKHRVGEFEKNAEGKEEVAFKAGDTLVMHSHLPKGHKDAQGMVHVPFADEDDRSGTEKLYESLKPGEKILMNDGKVAVEIVSKVKDESGWHVETRVESGQGLSRRKGVNFPGSALNMSAFTPKDINDLRAMINIGVDKIALSFVQTAQDIRDLRNIIEVLKKEGGADPNYNPKIIAKIEKPQAILNIKEIAQEADEIMFARGDLGVESPHEMLPAAKEFIFAAAKKYKKPFIMATQVAPSLQFGKLPNRTEVCAIDTYVKDKVDYLMFSEETAMGVDPVNAVAQMRICIMQSEFLHKDPQACFGEMVRTITPNFNDSSRADKMKELMALLEEQAQELMPSIAAQPAAVDADKHRALTV